MNLPLHTENTHVFKRAIWSITWLLMCRWTPRNLHWWRCFVVRRFGGMVHSTAHIYPSAIIWAPWNLIMDENSCIGDQVYCYNVNTVHLMARAVVSQKSTICTASHDIDLPDAPLVSGPITLGADSWVFSSAFILPGITIANGAVVGAFSLVSKSVPEWTVVAGNPARSIRIRKLNSKA